MQAIEDKILNKMKKCGRVSRSNAFATDTADPYTAKSDAEYSLPRPHFFILLNILSSIACIYLSIC